MITKSVSIKHRISISSDSDDGYSKDSTDKKGGGAEGGSDDSKDRPDQTGITNMLSFADFKKKIYIEEDLIARAL